MELIPHHLAVEELEGEGPVQTRRLWNEAQPQQPHGQPAVPAQARAS